MIYVIGMHPAARTRQLDQVRKLMQGGKWKALHDMARACCCPEQSISARVRDLRKPQFGGHTVHRVGVEKGLFLYRMEIS